jgi:hypothetical protein
MWGNCVVGSHYVTSPVFSLSLVEAHKPGLVLTVAPLDYSKFRNGCLEIRVVANVVLKLGGIYPYRPLHAAERRAWPQFRAPGWRRGKMALTTPHERLTICDENAARFGFKDCSLCLLGLW